LFSAIKENVPPCHSTKQQFCKENDAKSRKKKEGSSRGIE
jgi:hypothetical protein